MEYIFGTRTIGYDETEILKTIGKTHSSLSGRMSIIREFSDCTINDQFTVIDRYMSKEDEEGNCYDWYDIKDHFRDTDSIKVVKSDIDALSKQVESVTPYTETKIAYIGDTEVTFTDIPQGNITVYFDKPYTVDKLSDKITVHFDALEEVTEITISIMK